MIPNRSNRHRKKLPTAGFDWRPRTAAVAVIQQICILFLVFVSISPLAVAVITSFYPSDGFTSGRIVPPFADGTLDNYFRAWNDLLIPLIFWQKESLETLMVGLAALGPGRTSVRAVPLRMAGVSISIIPLIVLFLIARKALVRGLTEGSLR